jgi:hypothetical protein
MSACCPKRCGGSLWRWASSEASLPRMIRAVALAVLCASASLASAEARPCRPGEAPRFSPQGRPTCEGAQKLQPYDPAAQRSGSRPGFVDLGNGTEVRVGGRVQMDYDARPH